MGINIIFLKIKNYLLRIYENIYTKNIKCLLIFNIFFLNSITIGAVFIIEDSASIEQKSILTSDNFFIVFSYNSDGVFTSNTQFTGTSKCVGAHSFKKTKPDTMENSTRTINDLCAYKSGKYEFYIPFQTFDFDTSKTMAIKVPIISGTGPFKHLNGVLCDVAWITYNNEGYKSAYLMQATCKISDSKMEKIQNFKEWE